MAHYYIIGKIIRAKENGSVNIYLSEPNKSPTIFAGFAHKNRLELLLQGAVDVVDLFLCSNYLLDARIEIPRDILEYNMKISGER